jgi:(p)ppGpp synthase/HD superfamily hydrolase
MKGAQRYNILLAALGHDLLEDTSIDPTSLLLQFGENVMALISEATIQSADRSQARSLSRSGQSSK